MIGKMGLKAEEQIRRLKEWDGGCGRTLPWKMESLAALFVPFHVGARQGTCSAFTRGGRSKTEEIKNMVIMSTFLEVNVYERSLQPAWALLVW
ncbi:hypothetical protein V6N12_066452 [Hibiscus sabdariffa]|uniref:Uncharacterized protein n=1 Tax=Hibiscus sabdariffa TaxID=183260 RepID=A0ABR2CQJ9_9ROSI